MHAKVGVCTGKRKYEFGIRNFEKNTKNDKNDKNEMNAYIGKGRAVVCCEGVLSVVVDDHLCVLERLLSGCVLSCKRTQQSRLATKLEAV